MFCESQRMWKSLRLRKLPVTYSGNLMATGKWRSLRSRLYLLEICNKILPCDDIILIFTNFAQKSLLGASYWARYRQQLIFKNGEIYQTFKKVVSFQFSASQPSPSCRCCSCNRKRQNVNWTFWFLN